jgi:hypothetical protein
LPAEAGHIPVLMWHTTLPWWEFIVRGLLIYGFLLVALRLTGKRQIGQLAPFDLTGQPEVFSHWTLAGRSPVVKNSLITWRACGAGTRLRREILLGRPPNI